MDRRQNIKLLTAMAAGADEPALTQASQSESPSAAWPRIGIFAIGGAGRNALTDLIAKAPNRLGTIEINSHDAHRLRPTLCAHHTILIGEGLGPMLSPQHAREVAIVHGEAIETALEPFDLVFIFAGIGGATGTGVAPLVAEMAKSAGIFTISVVTTPFEFEGARRRANTASGLKALRASSDVVFTVDMERLLSLADDDLPHDAFLAEANGIFSDLYQCIHQALQLGNEPENLLRDIRYVFAQNGDTAMGFATGAVANSISELTMQAIKHPLLGLEALESAQGVLVFRRFGTVVPNFDDQCDAFAIVNQHMYRRKNRVGPRLQLTTLIYDPSMGETLSVSILATNRLLP